MNTLLDGFYYFFSKNKSKRTHLFRGYLKVQQRTSLNKKKIKTNYAGLMHILYLCTFLNIILYTHYIIHITNIQVYDSYIGSDIVQKHSYVFYTKSD